jgi:hypothetical protein
MSQVFLGIEYIVHSIVGRLKGTIQCCRPPNFAVMDRKSHLKDRNSDIPPIPFAALDYLLCAVTFLLVGIASNALIANLLVSIYR